MADTKTIARAVPMRQILSHFRVYIHRGDRRADCPLCKGNSRGTFAFTDHLWKCHRCGAGGDVFTLVRQLNRCDFSAALHYVADLAGVTLGRSIGAEIQARQRERERVQAAAEEMADAIRDSRLIARTLLQEIERKQRRFEIRLAALSRGEPSRFAEEEDSLWATMAACARLVRRYVAAYSLLSFGDMSDRVKFVTGDEANREAMIIGIMNAGFIRCGDSVLHEVAL